MPPIEYRKPFRSNMNLVEHLIQKGLNVNDKKKAESILLQINYYRFKIYLRPFLDSSTNKYKKDSYFNDGIALYRFDNELKDFLFSIIGRLEVKLRSRLDQVVTENTDNPFWYLDDNLFEYDKRQSIYDVRKKIDEKFQRSKDDFVNHFRTKYFNSINEKYKHLPPFWIAAELTTFGNVLVLYESLEKGRFLSGPRSNKLDDLACEFGAPNLAVLNGWLKALRDIRNRCAHHSRIWNCNYREPPKIKQMISKQFPPSHSNRIYLIFVLVCIMSKNIGIEIDMRGRLSDMLSRHPIVNEFYWSAGIPSNWDRDPIWT